MELYGCTQGTGPDGKYGISEVVQLIKDFSDMVHKIDHLINEGYVKQLMIMEMLQSTQQQINPHFYITHLIRSIGKL